MTRQLKVACLQTRPQPGFKSALSEALTLAEKAANAGAELLALPEYCGGLKTEGTALSAPSAPEAEHPVLGGLKDFAATRGVWILVGSVAVTGPCGKYKNRSFVIDDNGQIRARYDKIHMFDIQLSEREVYHESASVSPGKQAVISDLLGCKIGHSICYDIRFPALYRDLAQSGAEILVVPAAFTKKTGEAHWHVLNRARAIENGAFVVAPCAIGRVEGGGESYGHSLIINPWGAVLADGGDLAGVVQATIRIDEVAVARSRIPSLSHDCAFTSSREHNRDIA
jgi:predicted amidohydrolase